MHHRGIPKRAIMLLFSSQSLIVLSDQCNSFLSPEFLSCWYTNFEENLLLFLVLLFRSLLPALPWVPWKSDFLVFSKSLGWVFTGELLLYALLLPLEVCTITTIGYHLCGQKMIIKTHNYCWYSLSVGQYGFATADTWSCSVYCPLHFHTRYHHGTLERPTECLTNKIPSLWQG